MLRSGYVYVFDEQRNHWSEYFVTTNGFLSKMPPRIRALKVQPRPRTEFQCASNGAAPMAGVITIQNPQHADKVWIAFSDVEWTDKVFADHLNAEQRKKHMLCITVKGGKVAAQPHAAPLEQLEALVPEYALPARLASASFAAWCPHAYNSREGAAAALLNTSRRVRPGGGAAIVALHDPVGLATEIAALMEVRKTTFINHERLAKPRFAANSIVSLEASIKEQAKAAEVQAGEELAQQAEQGPAATTPTQRWPASQVTTRPPSAGATSRHSNFKRSPTTPGRSTRTTGPASRGSMARPAKPGSTPTTKDSRSSTRKKLPRWPKRMRPGCNTPAWSTT